MVDVTEGLRAAAPSGHPPVAVGYLSTIRPAPATFDDPIWVIVPSHSEDRPYGPCPWPAIHGNTKPTQGTTVWIAFDDNHAPVVISWEGNHS
jgi:hypothetical protein